MKRPASWISRGAEMFRRVAQMIGLFPGISRGRTASLLDIGMTTAITHFLAEPITHFRQDRSMRQQHLQRDDSVRVELPRPVHHAHAAAGDFLNHLQARNGEQESV